MGDGPIINGSFQNHCFNPFVPPRHICLTYEKNQLLNMKRGTFPDAADRLAGVRIREKRRNQLVRTLRLNMYLLIHDNIYSVCVSLCECQCMRTNTTGNKQIISENNNHGACKRRITGALKTHTGGISPVLDGTEYLLRSTGTRKYEA